MAREKAPPYREYLHDLEQELHDPEHKREAKIRPRTTVKRTTFPKSNLRHHHL